MRTLIAVKMNNASAIKFIRTSDSHGLVQYDLLAFSC
jgi:hypothetical protein